MEFTETRAMDWEIASAASIGGAEIIGGGTWLFLLKSTTVKVEAKYLFTSVGVGGGGWTGASGVSLPSSDRFDPSSAYSPLKCLRSFSLGDLHNAPGIISAGGYNMGAKVGKFGAGFGGLAITALTLRGSLFALYTGGFGGGAKGASAFGGLGLWQCLGGKRFEEQESAWDKFLRDAKYEFKRYKKYRDAVEQAQAGTFI